MTKKKSKHHNEHSAGSSDTASTEPDNSPRADETPRAEIDTVVSEANANAGSASATSLVSGTTAFADTSATAAVGIASNSPAQTSDLPLTAPVVANEVVGSAASSDATAVPNSPAQTSDLPLTAPVIVANEALDSGASSDTTAAVEIAPNSPTQTSELSPVSTVVDTVDSSVASSETTPVVGAVPPQQSEVYPIPDTAVASSTVQNEAAPKKKRTGLKAAVLAVMGSMFFSSPPAYSSAKTGDGDEATSPQTASAASDVGSLANSESGSRITDEEAAAVINNDQETSTATKKTGLRRALLAVMASIGFSSAANESSAANSGAGVEMGEFGSDNDGEGESHFREVKDIIEVFCVGLKVGQPCEKFSVRLPDGVVGGTLLKNIDGAGHSAVVPLGYGAGDTIILLLPKSQKTGDLPLPNRNCPAALRVVVDESEEYFLEGTVEEEDIMDADEQSSRVSFGATMLYHFVSDAEDGKMRRNIPLSMLLDITHEGEKSVRPGDKVISYKKVDTLVLSHGVVIGTDGDFIVVNFADGDRLRVKRTWVFHQKRYRPRVEVDLAESNVATEDILAELEFASDTGSNAPAYNKWTSTIGAMFGCYTLQRELLEIGEKHISMRKAIHNRDMRSVRKLKPDGTFEYYSFWKTVIPLYWFPGISWCCSKSAESKSILDKYGFGVVSYFKLVKSLIIIFGVMAIITLPNCGIYFKSNSSWGREQFYELNTNGVATLKLLTIAAMGEPNLVCREGLESETVELTCPKNKVLRSVVAYYGQPTGSCSCPTLQQVNQEVGNSGTCQAEPSANPTLGCIPDEDGATYGCFLGSDRFGNKCCAYDQKLVEISSASYSSYAVYQEVADLQDMNLAAARGCNSNTAQAMATALCEGQKSCSLSVSGADSRQVPLAQLPSEFDRGLCQAISSEFCTLKLNSGWFTECKVHSTTDNAYNSKYLYPTYDIDPLSGDISSVFKERRLIVEGFCDVDFVTIIGNQYDPAGVAFYTSVANAVSIVVFLIGVSWIKWQMKNESLVLSDNTVKASDYTVACYTLPAEARNAKIVTTLTEVKEKLKDFFERVLFDETDGAPVDVADVNLVTSCDTYLTHCVERGAAAHEVDVVIARIQSRIRRKVWDPTDAHSKVLLTKLKETLLEFEYANDVCVATSFQAEQSSHMAYITFAEEDAYLKALKKYPYVGTLTGLTQHKDDKYQGQTVFLTPAPDPDDIKFENVPVPTISRIFRVLLTTIATLLLLAISYAMIYQARYVADIYSLGVTEVDCSAYKVDVAPYTLQGSKVVSVKVPKTVAKVAGTIGYYDVVMDTYPEFYQLNATKSTWGQRGIKKCYCSEIYYSAYLNGESSPSNVMTSYPFINPYGDEGEEKKLCKAPVDPLTIVFKIVATLVVVVNNAILGVLLTSMISFERHASKTGELMSSAFKLFIAQYINTAILIIIINGDLNKANLASWEWSGTVEDVPELNVGFFSGRINDYNTKWYLSIGTSIMLTMMIFSIAQLPLQYFQVLWQKILRLWDRRWSFKHGFSLSNTQEELDQMYLGPEMPLQDKYGYILTLIFVDMTFSPTMPLFNFITFFNLIVFYLSDKYCLLYFFTKPPNINATLPKAVVNTLYLAAVIHMANGVWMFGNDAYYDPGIENDYSVQNLGWDTNQSKFHYSLKNSHAYRYSDGSPKSNTIIVWQDRFLGKQSLPLSILLVFCGALIVLGFLRAFFVDVIGLKTCWRALGNYLDKNYPVWNFVGGKSMALIGHPPYFESISTFVLKQRFSEHTLDPLIEAKYVHYIEEEEEDKKKLGLAYTVEAARMLRIMRAAENFEHRRRQSLMRLSMSDMSRISLDNLDAAHDVTGFIEDMKKKDKAQRKAEKASIVSDLALKAADGIAQTLAKRALGAAPDIENFHSAAAETIASRKHHGASLQKALPNRNCPVAYAQPGLKLSRFYEGAYLQYTDPKDRFGHKSKHKTHFTFMKHESDETTQNAALEIADVDPHDICVLSRTRPIPFDYGSDVDEDFAVDDVVGLEDCCGAAIGVKYNNMHFSRSAVDKSFIREDTDIPLFEDGDAVVFYENEDSDYMIHGVVCGVSEQVTAENDPVESEPDNMHTKKLQNLLKMSKSALQKNEKYEARYKRCINSRTAMSVVSVQFDEKILDLPVQWVWLKKPLKTNRTGTFNIHSGIDFLNRVCSGYVHNAAPLAEDDPRLKKVDTEKFFYKGRLLYGRPSGEGKFYYANDDVYTGKFVNGFFHGSGAYMYANCDDDVDPKTGLKADGSKPARDFYEGDFYKGYRHGYGVFACNSGKRSANSATAPVAAPAATGAASFDAVNGSLTNRGERSRIDLVGRPYLYQGEWRHGKLHGYGKKIFTDGSGIIQVGDWVDGEPANGYYQPKADGTGWETREKPTLEELRLPPPPPKTTLLTPEARAADLERARYALAVMSSKLLVNRLFERGQLAENTAEWGKCIPTFDDNTHDYLKDRCGNTVYICTCCCTCKCAPASLGPTAIGKNTLSKVRRHKHNNRGGRCGVCGDSSKVDDSTQAAIALVGDKFNSAKGTCCKPKAPYNSLASSASQKVNAETDVYDDDVDVDEQLWNGYDKATGLHIGSLLDGSTFKTLASLSRQGSATGSIAAGGSSDLGNKVLETPAGDLVYGNSDSVGLGGAGGPEEAREIFEAALAAEAERPSTADTATIAASINRKALDLDKAEQGIADNDDKDGDLGGAMIMVGHESYNLNTIRDYQKKFGLETAHMARMITHQKDMILQVTNLLQPNDPEQIRQVLVRCAPYKLKKSRKVHKPVRKLKPDAEKDPLTGEYHARDYIIVNEEVEDFEWLVPSHSLFLSRNMPRVFGGVAACNERVGCECLAEPDDHGNQPKRAGFCC